MTSSSARTWLVTGGAGFIGANLVHHLCARGDIRVVNLDALTYAGNLGSLEALADHPNHVFVNGDIGDESLVSDLLERYQPEAVLNLAAESHVDRSISGPAPFVETNVVGAFKLLQAALHHWQGLEAERKERFRFLHVSTDEVFGTLAANDAGFRETTPYAPNSPYAASKAGADHFARAFHRTYGLPVVTTNCSNNYGPYQFPEKLIPLMIHNALRGEPLPVYGDGLQIRDWLYVEDHCRALCTAVEHGTPGETYNVGGRAERTNMEIVRLLCALLDEHAPDSPHRPHADLLTHVPDRPGHDRRYAIDDAKIRDQLGWSPEETLERGLEKTVRWYLDNQAWVESIRSGEYTEWLNRNYGNRLREAT